MSCGRKNCNCTSRLCPLAFALALGIIWAVALFAMALVAHYTPIRYGLGFVNGIGTLYLGYKATIIGAVIGSIWGFVDCFIFGIVLAWLYNCLLCSCRCKTK